MKTLRNWAIATLIFTLIFAALSIVCIFKPEGFGLFVVTTAEDITCNMGYTIEGMYAKLSIISYVLLGVFFVTNQVLWIAYACKKKTCCENKEEKVEETVNKKLTREEKKALKDAKKAERKKKIDKVIDNVAANVTEVAAAMKDEQKLAAPKNDNERLASILDQLRRG